MITAFTAYKDTAGKLHTSLESVQTAERRAMYADILKAGTSANPQLARLDPTLVVDFCMALGKSIGDVANDRLAPSGVGPGGAKAEPGYRPTIGEQEARARELLRPVRSAPELAMPYGQGEKLSPEEPARKRNENSDSKVENSRPFGIPAAPMANAVGDSFPGNETMSAETRALREKVWPKHPLDPAQSRAEGMEPAPVNTTPVGVKVPVVGEDLMELELVGALDEVVERGMRASGGYIARPGRD